MFIPTSGSSLKALHRSETLRPKQCSPYRGVTLLQGMPCRGGFSVDKPTNSQSNSVRPKRYREEAVPLQCRGAYATVSNTDATAVKPELPYFARRHTMINPDWANQLHRHCTGPRTLHSRAVLR